MGTDRKIEQRAKVDPGFSSGAACCSAFPARMLGLIVIAGLASIALLDFLTGDRLWVGPAYITSIDFAAWALGWRQASAALLRHDLIRRRSNIDSLYPYYAPVTVWDYRPARSRRCWRSSALLCLRAHGLRHAVAAGADRSLTGALNRKAFFELAGRSRNRRAGTCSPMPISTDSSGSTMPRAQDRRGSASGPSPAMSRKAIRKDDIFARIGGDEFPVYLRGARCAGRADRRATGCTGR